VLLDSAVATYRPSPSVLAGAIGLAALYWLCTGRYRSRFHGSEPVSLPRQIAFYGGVLLGLLALASPLDTLGDAYLFTAHMLQHLLLTLGVAPLLLIGTPGWLLRDALRAIPERQRAVVYEHYVNERSLRSIGKSMHVSPQRASQLHLAAMTRLQAFVLLPVLVPAAALPVPLILAPVPPPA